MRNKVFLGFFVLLLSSWSLWSQVVTSVPTYATENDSIVVIFDATQGDQGLKGYTGDVYAHTGVITNYSTNPHDWKHVIADWNVNVPKAKLTRIGTDLYRLTIGYPREYYNVTDPQERILQLAFVFRSPDGSRTGRDVGGEDIFLDLYEPGVSVVIVQPAVDLSYGDPQRSPVFADAQDTIPVVATAALIGTQLAELQVLVDGALAASTTEDTVRYEFLSAGRGSGFHQVNVVAVDTAGVTDTSAFVIMINPPVQEAPWPAGTIDGINYTGPTSVTLSLFAPYKKFVYLIGDFNDWKVDTTYYLKKYVINEDSVHWWIRIDGLSPGREYAFQYLVDGEIRIADPYTDKILDPWNDSYIPDNIYPNLKPYPRGKTDYPVAVLQTAQTPFQWVYSDTFQRPPQKDLVIYELLLRDFLAQHDFNTLRDTLDYFQKLGINAIELMPISEFEGNSSWGYNPSFYFAPDKYYGPKNTLKKFVDECHRRGLAVIMDIVLNHSYGQSPLVRLYWDAAHSRPAANNPWYNQTSPNPTYSWGYDFNHESPATQKFVDRVIRYWITEYRIDGYRFDFTKGFTNTPGDGWYYDASRIRILKRMADKIWQTDSTAYIILEHFTENREEQELADYGMMLWGNLNYNYAEATMGYHDNGKSDFSWGYYGSRGWSQPNLVTYMESHDEERLMYKNKTWGNSSGDYNVKDLATALDRMKLAGAFFFTYPGPKMIWQFGELGYDYSIDYNGRLGEKPIRWDYFRDFGRRTLFKVWAALLKLRRENEVFRSPDTQVELWLNDSAGRKRLTLRHPSMDVVIVGNFGVTPLAVSGNFSRTGWWYDYFSGDSLEVFYTSQTVNLQPGEFHIFTTRKLETPEQGIITAVDLTTGDVPLTYRLLPNYPNPFNPGTTVQFEVPEPGKVSLVVYNLLGQKVRTLAEGEFTPGRYHRRWDGTDETGQPVASGIYLLYFKAGDYRQTRRMLLLR